MQKLRIATGRGIAFISLNLLIPKNYNLLIYVFAFLKIISGLRKAEIYWIAYFMNVVRL